MSAHAGAEANFFASLLNPSEVVAACERSAALNSLASQKHCADRPGRKRSGELAAWDDAVDQGKSDAEWRRRNLAGGGNILTSDVMRVEAAVA